MNTRIFVSKKPTFDVENQKLQKEIHHVFPEVRIQASIIYDVFHTSEQELEQTKYSVFGDKVVDTVFTDFPFQPQAIYFAKEYHSGQYDQRADSAEQAYKLITGNQKIQIKTGILYELYNCDDVQLASIKNLIINKVDSQEKDINILQISSSNEAKKVEIVHDFIQFNSSQLLEFFHEQQFSFDFDDLLFIQDYFQKENRNPTETELKVLDTYWSDHCRHTTFLTELTNIEFSGNFQERLTNIFENYLHIRKETNREHKPISLMDLATVCAKYFHKIGKLNDLVISDEINACTIQTTILVDGKEEEWELLFKNETHNHPTEIEPFGGASTCIGGAIRDPLSGRAFVYQAMRITGSGNPMQPIEQTLQGKLPQRKITQTAAQGYSSYGNQIGVPTSHVTELYHEGYVAKRMEVGMVVGAVPKQWIRREKPKKGDRIIVFGGKTGRDGVGGATGSSKEHTEESIHTMSAEVQKGDAVQERKMQRFFRNPEVLQCIKKCNDFGAGGISVAIGEIADGISINLNAFPTKYIGLNGTELALSESQERMAVVVEEKDVSRFISLAEKETLLAVEVGEVTDYNRLEMLWNGTKIVDLDRNFLDSSGVLKHQKVNAKSTSEPFSYTKKLFSRDTFQAELQQLNGASQKGLIEQFDSTVGKTSIFMPLGGKFQRSPMDVSVHTFPVLHGKTEAVSMASWGFCPEISSWSPLHGGAFAVVESVAKLAAAGADFRNIRLSFQEYFEKLNQNPEKWGKPLQSLLGAYEAQMAFELAAIGGKDSMSGSFNEIHVPPTLISFAVAVGNVNDCISTEFKSNNSHIYLINHVPDDLGMPNYKQLIQNFEFIRSQISSQNCIAAKTVKNGGIACELFKMCIGNAIGAEISFEDDVLMPRIGSIILETTHEITFENALYLGKTTQNSLLTINSESFDLDELHEIWSETFSDVFPSSDTKIISNEKPTLYEHSFHPKAVVKIAKPKVLLPIFPGTNCEYETIHAFEKEQANAHSFMFNNMNHDRVQQSIHYFTEQLKSSQILVFSGGFSAGDEPDGSAKYIVSVLKNPEIKQAIHEFLQNDGLIVGICNGFQALVKSGLLPYGSVKDVESHSPTLTFNSIGRHINQMAKVKVVSDKSIWLKGMLGMEYVIPFSHGEGRFYAQEETLNQLKNKQLIATQYITNEGNIALSMPENPNGSVFGIEGISDETGRIYGRMGHPERYEFGLLKNIPDVSYMNIFKNGVDYFR